MSNIQLSSHCQSNTGEMIILQNEYIFLHTLYGEGKGGKQIVCGRGYCARPSFDY